MSTSADLGIEYIAGQQAQPEISHNTALNQVQMLQTGVVSVGLNTPPGSPAQGDTYILGASPTGAWSGRANCIAGYFGTGWVFVPGNNSAGTAIAMGVRHEGLKVWNKTDDKLYIWSGSAWAALASGMTNPMTTSQDLIVGGASGTPGRLAIGTNGFVLTAVAGAVAWAAATGFANPMTTSGDIIYGGASGVATRLAAGTNGHVLTLAGGVPSWAANTAMANPMTTAGDLILGGASGVAGRLGIGSTGQVLTVVGGTAAWATPAGGSQAGSASASATLNDYPFYSGVGGFSSSVLNSTTRCQISLVQLDSALTFTDIVIAVRTASAATSMDVGIYNFLGAGKPGTCAASANISTAATGRIAVTLGSPVTLSPGLYYVVLHGTSTTPTIVVETQTTNYIPGYLAGLTISDAMTQLAAGTTTLTAVLFNDSSLPGGSYTRGMDLTGMTMSSGNIVGYNTWVPVVALKKQ